MCRFIIGLTFPPCLTSEHLIKAETFFPQIVDHARTIERGYIKTYMGFDKLPCDQYSVIGVPFGSRDSPKWDPYYF